MIVTLQETSIKNRKMKFLGYTYRLLFSGIMISIALLVIIACGNNEDNDEPGIDDAELLIGKWYQSATWTERNGYQEETIDRNNWYITLTFERDGTATTEVREYDEIGRSKATYTYDVKNRIIHFTTSNGQKIDAQVLELTTKTLTLSITIEVSVSGQTLVNNKKVYYIK